MEYVLVALDGTMGGLLLTSVLTLHLQVYTTFPLTYLALLHISFMGELPNGVLFVVRQHLWGTVGLHCWSSQQHCFVICLMQRHLDRVFVISPSLRKFLLVDVAELDCDTRQLRDLRLEEDVCCSRPIQGRERNVKDGRIEHEQNCIKPKESESIKIMGTAL